MLGEAGAMFETARKKLGRRGAMLTLLGIVYILVGYGAVSRPQERVNGAFMTYLPDWIIFILWGVCGLTAICFAWRKFDEVGWLALYIPAGLRFISWIGSWVIHLIPGGQGGFVSGWYNAAFTAPFIIVALICSGWKECPDIEEDPAR